MTLLHGIQISKIRSIITTCGRIVLNFLILRFMKNENRALKITEIADGLKKNHNTIKKYLETLINLKLVEIEKEKSRKLYKINQERLKKIVKLVRSG